MVLVLGKRVRTPRPVPLRPPPVFRGGPGGPPPGPPGSQFLSPGLAAQTLGHFNERHGRNSGLLAYSEFLRCFACLRVGDRAHLDGCSEVKGGSFVPVGRANPALSVMKRRYVEHGAAITRVLVRVFHRAAKVGPPLSCSAKTCCSYRPWLAKDYPARGR